MMVDRFTSKRPISDSDSFRVAINNSASAGGAGWEFTWVVKKKIYKRENKKSQLRLTRTRPSRVVDPQWVTPMP